MTAAHDNSVTSVSSLIMITGTVHCKENKESVNKKRKRKEKDEEKKKEEGGVVTARENVWKIVRDSL